MKTIKIIDLLNKMSKGEDVPKKIKIGKKVYNYEEFIIGRGEKYFDAQREKVNGYRYDYDGVYYYLEIRDYNLNDEVEIIEPEEDNKIGKIIPTSLKGIDNLDEKIEVAHLDTISATDKLNELIDEVNKLKEGK